MRIANPLLLEHDSSQLESASELRERRANKRGVERLLTSAAHDMAESDVNGDAKLDFEEFYAMQPRSIREAHSQEDVRAWFENADLDGDGVLSVNEFFLWAVRNASATHGVRALVDVFDEHDENGSGKLDMREFEQLCISMGFQTGIQDIFRLLDVKNSGTISYRDMARKFAVQPPSNSRITILCTRLMLACGRDSNEAAGASLDTSNWVVRGSSFEEVRRSLQQALSESGQRVADLISLFDQDHEAAEEIDDVEFCWAMRERCGYKGSAHLLLEVFRTLDSDHSATRCSVNGWCYCHRRGLVSPSSRSRGTSRLCASSCSRCSHEAVRARPTCCKCTTPTLTTC